MEFTPEFAYVVTFIAVIFVLVVASKVMGWPKDLEKDLKLMREISEIVQEVVYAVEQEMQGYPGKDKREEALRRLAIILGIDYTDPMWEYVESALEAAVYAMNLHQKMLAEADEPTQ